MARTVSQNLSLEDFSIENNVSISYLKLLFAKYAGISPKAYYTNLRVRHATELLKEGMSVAEVADQMAFSSPNYFSSFYKKKTGVLPSEIRKKGPLE